VLWDLNCNYLETGHFQTAQEVRRGRQSRISGADHWPEDTTREASVAAAEGKATSFKPAYRKLAGYSPTRRSAAGLETPPKCFVGSVRAGSGRIVVLIRPILH